MRQASDFFKLQKISLSLGLGLFSLVILLCLPHLAFAQCTNCTTTNVGDDVVLTFTSGSGTFTPPSGVTSVRYLVVGGGGGGGGIPGSFFGTEAGAGGGGGGGVRSGTLNVTPSVSYPITVGAGGVAGIGDSRPGGNGGPSSFSSIVSAGGGGGASSGSSAQSGGSGGGGRLNSNGANGTSGQGNSGGDGAGSNGGAGGGGGAGAAGASGSGRTGGSGGGGISTDITGSTMMVGGGGGGGGSPILFQSGPGGPGGSGGGGAAPSSRGPGANGAANTGGGGGGATGGSAIFSASDNGGAGGSGIVIIRYTPNKIRYAVNNGNWNNTNTWSSASCSGSGGAAVPIASDEVIICNGRSVTLTAAAAAYSVTLATGNNNVTLQHNAGVSLEVGAGGMTVHGATGGSNTKSWSIGAGNATINGPLNLIGGNDNSRVARIALTSGNLDINGDLSINSNGVARAVIEATGAANISLAGSFNMLGGTARLLPGSASTFTYDGTGTQTALLGVSEINYHHLVFAGSGTKNQTSWSLPTITGNTTVNSGVTFNNSAAVIYEGEFTNNGTTSATAANEYRSNFNNNGRYSATAAQQYRQNFTNSGTFTSGEGLHSFNGSGTQQLAGETVFFRLQLDNPAGLVLQAEVMVEDQLHLTNGAIITGSHVLRVAQAGNWSGIHRANGWVAGNLGLWMPTGWQGRTFEIGDANAYRPLTLTIPNVTTAGFIVASISQTSGDHPAIDSANLDPARSVNRWWSITSEGAAMVTMDASFAYLTGDLDTGATPANFKVQRFAGGSWNDVTASSGSATSAQATGITGFGEFAIAEPGAPAPGCDVLVSGLMGHYFNNMNVAGAPEGTRVDSTINFNWGTGTSGVAGVNADNFSVRWEGLLRTTQGGNYRFQTVSDDGIRLWVNGVLIIDHWNDHSATTHTSGDIALGAGQTYSIRVEYYENFIDSEIRLRWRTPGSGSYVVIPAGPTPTLGAGLYHCQVAQLCENGEAGGGLEGSYFNNRFLTGNPAGTRIDGPINFTWASGSPGVAGVGDDQFSVRWQGSLRATTTGSYQFQTDSDDGVRLWVDDVLVINDWRDHSVATTTSGNVNLEAGEVYSIRMEYYENGGQSAIRLRWRVPGSGSFVPIPAGPTPTLGAGLYHCPKAPVVAAYQFTHAGTGLTCEAEEIVVTAVDSSGNPIAPPAGTTAVLATDPATGVWVGGDAHGFNGSDTSFIRYLRQTSPANLALLVTDSIASGTSSISFADVGLRFDGLPASPDSAVAGMNYSGASLRVVQTNSETGVCETRVTGSRAVGLGYECLDPLTCGSGQSFTVNGGAIGANNNGALSSYSDVTLNFDAAGIATIPFEFSDVGRVRLHGRLSLPAEGNDPAVTLLGSSADFVVRPHSLVLTDVRNASWQANTGSAAFAAAGESFRVTVEARNARGQRTPNFGNEVSPEGISLRLGDLVYPVGGTLGALSNPASFVAIGTPGEFINEVVSWSEVGTINLNAHITDGEYLGTGDVVEAPDVAVGRFYPHHFNLTSSTIEDSCSGFTYLGHPAMRLSYQLEARNLQNSVTTNYHSPAYVETASVNYVAEDGNNGVDLGSRVVVEDSSWSAGIFAVDTESAMFARKPHQALPLPATEADGPFSSLQLGLRLTGGDSRPLEGMDMNPLTAEDCTLDNSCTAMTLGGPRMMRFGRLRLDDAFGPESVNLPVNFATEFWTGGFFAPATTDECTQIPRTAISYPAGPIANDGNRTVVLNGGSTQGNYADLQSDNVTFRGGSAGHFFTAPGTGTGSFTVDVDLQDLPWLRYDWNQNGNFSDDVRLRANFGFGQYRGHDHIIYWREVFE